MGAEKPLGGMTLEQRAAAMRARYPGLPERDITGTPAWKDRIRAEASGDFIQAVRGAGKVLKPEIIEHWGS